MRKKAMTKAASYSTGPERATRMRRDDLLTVEPDCRRLDAVHGGAIGPGVLRPRTPGDYRRGLGRCDRPAPATAIPGHQGRRGHRRTRIRLWRLGDPGPWLLPIRQQALHEPGALRTLGGLR